MSVDDKRSWIEHCHTMADATYQLAEQAKDYEMKALYIDIAARWLVLANRPERRPTAQGRCPSLAPVA